MGAKGYLRRVKLTNLVFCERVLADLRTVLRSASLARYLRRKTTGSVGTPTTIRGSAVSRRPPPAAMRAATGP